MHRHSWRTGSAVFLGFLLLAAAGIARAAFDITIDATALTRQPPSVFNVGNLDPGIPTTFALDPGTYNLRSGQNGFHFQVTAAGAVDYDSSLDPFLTGRGTDTLVVNGFDLTIDAVALTRQSLGVFDVGDLVPGAPTLFTLIPGSFNFRSDQNGFHFQVAADGTLDYDAALDAFVAGRGTDTLAISGFDVTVDARALLPQHLRIFNVGDIPSDIPIVFTLIPGTFQFRGEPDLFNFQLEADGLLSGLPVSFQGVPVSGNGTSLLFFGDPGPPPCTPSPPDLIGWWTGNENANDWFDGNHGILAGVLAGIPGKVGGAFDMTQVVSEGHHVHIPDFAAVEVEASDFSVVAWVKASDLGTSQGRTIASKYGTGGVPFRSGWYFAVRDFRPEIQLYKPFNAPLDQSAAITRSTETIDTGQFYHLAAVVDRSLPKARLFIDGAEVSTTQEYLSTASFLGVDISSTNPLLLGQDVGPLFATGQASGLWSGLLDEVALYRRALAPGEIQALFLAQSAGQCFPLCGDGVVNDPEEECDDGNALDDDGCSSACRLQVCGNTITELPEECDDGGTVDGDGCSATCEKELCESAVPADLVGWWNGDAAEGSALDVWGGNHGTLVNGATTVPGKVGSALDLDGFDDFVQIPDDDSLDVGTSDFSVGAWLRADSFLGTVESVQNAIAMKMGLVEPGVPISSGWFFGLSHGRPKISVLGDYNAVTTAADPIGLFGWHHVMAIVDRGEGQSRARIYVDGVEVSTNQTNAYLYEVENDDLSNSAVFVIGRDNLGTPPTSHWDGQIDEVQFFHRALSAVEVQSIFAAGSQGLCVPDECDDGIDNDGDGATDFPDDPGCEAVHDPFERSPLLACDDGEDNDSDSATDFPADPGCWHPAAPLENPQCNDGLENDTDGLIDLADPECRGRPWWNSESRANVCALDSEVALVLAALLCLRRLRCRKAA